MKYERDVEGAIPYIIFLKFLKDVLFGKNLYDILISWKI